MVEITQGNLLKTDAEALVNTVNCMGHMGKGIALQFKQAFPENLKAYEKVCQDHQLHPGRMLVFKTGMLQNPKYIINFPTKRHWKGKARIEDIHAGLSALAEEVRQLGIHSVAVPPLGCGLGGLDWSEVRPMIEEAFQALPDVHVLLFPPTGAPAAMAMPVRTDRPNMTPARALFLKLTEQYLVPAYRLTLLEIHKLAYFLQEAGEKLRLNFGKGHYGPYASNLNKVLERIEGHFIRGYGDSQKPDVAIELLPQAVQEADQFLTEHQASKKRLERVAELIEGFETPYGMELISSVHWVVTREGAKTPDEAIAATYAWNERKRMFKPDHLRKAWDVLQQKGWFPQR
jgi:O-acetyl-ADP-ribose deacetylase (regulator of RNase III)